MNQPITECDLWKLSSWNLPEQDSDPEFLSLDEVLKRNRRLCQQGSSYRWVPADQEEVKP